LDWNAISALRTTNQELNAFLALDFQTLLAPPRGVAGKYFVRKSLLIFYVEQLCRTNFLASLKMWHTWYKQRHLAAFRETDKYVNLQIRKRQIVKKSVRNCENLQLFGIK
jgi:hypothetical protein